MDVQAAAVRWTTTFREAWPAGEVDRFLALYGDDALLHSPPREPEPARSHMRRVLTAGRPDPEVHVGKPLVAGEWAVVEWRAVITVSNEEPKTFARTAWLRFDDDA